MAARSAAARSGATPARDASCTQHATSTTRPHASAASSDASGAGGASSSGPADEGAAGALSRAFALISETSGCRPRNDHAQSTT